MYLDFAVTDHGEVLSIDQVGHGRLKGVYCPYCMTPVMARKGKKIAHHFAHDGPTCAAASRSNETLSIPAFDRFDLTLSQDDLAVLRSFQKIGYADVPGMKWSKQRRIAEWLLYHGFVVETKGYRDIQTELTPKGRIPFGDLPLKAFVVAQRALIEEKHAELVRNITGYKVDHQQALIDLRLFRARLSRALQSNLYLAEIHHSEGVIYKIGVTGRDPVDQRMVEIRRDLEALGMSIQKIDPLRVLANQGLIERYAHFRHETRRMEVGDHREFFDFTPRKFVLADFTKADDREVMDWEQDLIDGIPHPVDPGQSQVTLTVNDPRRGEYQRVVDLVPYSIWCPGCHQTKVTWRYPGRKPKYCSDDCQEKTTAAARRKATRERVRKHRAKKRAEKQEQ